ALGLARLEQLDDTRQAVRDVRAGDTAGVERPHRQLGAGLADRLRRDDADGIADLGQCAAGQRPAIARLAHARGRLALEHGADRYGDLLALAVLGLEGLGDLGQLGAVDLLPGLEQGAPALGLE